MAIDHTEPPHSGSSISAEDRVEEAIVEQLFSTNYGMALIAWSIIFEGLGFLMMYILIRATVTESAAQDVVDQPSPRDQAESISTRRADAA